MPVHALDLNDFCEEAYALIGIHTSLEDYRLAYLLNKNLKTHFTKSKEDLVYTKEGVKASFSIYNYTSKVYDFEWFLIANSYKKENQTALNELLLTTETKTYLIPEKKKIDFFIKISGETNNNYVVEQINKIKCIEQVITAYTIEKTTLKSKDHLIF
ncbi:IPExxxVDY family protein [uncultured Polaribacter sp.]|uniref:IPExxxVDY family protein n=1 Tax=uncultured Polaribacter sp. TaxID=174711 RepID=UPI002607FC96|nr:IPExxxVDY family protein [uncultured Polaribacter sp.]